MKILMLVNWKIQYCNTAPADKQPPDYCVEGEPYWFFRYFKEQPEVDVVDASSFLWLEKFEKNKLRFYSWQTLRVLPKLNQYDLILSHGMQSGVVLSLWRRLFKTRAKHIVFDIGSFNSAAESGLVLKLMQCTSKSIDGLIYHTSSQIDYYSRFFPWLVSRSKFIRFGTDLEYFDSDSRCPVEAESPYYLCVGALKRDWATLVRAYQKLDTRIKLRFVGHVDESLKGIPGIEQIPFVPIQELIEQIRGAKLCILPLESFNYSYGQMTLMQQIALGKCVIAARVPSIVDYVEDGKTAVLYTPGDAADLADKMLTLAEKPALCQEIAQNGRQWLRHHCNEAIMAEEIETFLRNMTQR